MREAAVDVTGEIAEADAAFVEKMIDDPNADVRVAVARRLEHGLLVGPIAVAIVEDRLRREHHPMARAALLHAQANFCG